MRPFEEKWLAPVIVLLSRGRGSEESLLRMREQRLSDGQWLAVNNLLLTLKSRPFFARTLSEVTISHRFILTDPGNLGGIRTDRGPGGATCGDGILSMPKGFPPIGFYEILDRATKGDVLLAAGPENAYYRRVVVPTDRYVGFGSCGGLNRGDLRIGYLATLSKLSTQEVDNLFRASTEIEFRGDADLRQRMESALKSQEAAIRAFVQTAKERGLGTSRGITLRIVPQIGDRRKTTAGPAPSLAPREFVLD